MAKQNFFQRNERLLIYAGGAAILYFGFAKPILNKLGITNSAKDRENERKVNQSDTEPDITNPLSPEYWKLFVKKNPNKGTFLTMAGRDMYATRLHKAMADGYTQWTDDEAAVYGVFRTLKNWLQISQVADTFQQKYKRDLWQFLKDGDNAFSPWAGLNKGELAIVHDIVYSKPKF
jgi:hypothetical protein